jgi:hypothetical protein
MKSFKSYKENQSSLENLLNEFREIKEIVEIPLEELIETFLEYISSNRLDETANVTRYSVEVNYNTDQKDFLKGYAKIVLGYVSAALKKQGFHCRIVFSEEPYRVIVTSRNWDDGEPVAMITYNQDHNFFVLSKGTYNKLKKTVTINSKEKIDGTISSYHMVNKIKKDVEEMKNQVLKKNDDLKKRGPKS